MKFKLFAFLVLLPLIKNIYAQTTRDTIANEEFLSEWFRVWDEGDLDGFKRITSKDLIDHDADINYKGDHYKGLLEALKSISIGFSDAAHKPENVYHLPNGRVIVRWEFEGRQTGHFAGRPATGEIVKFKGIEILQITNGLLTEIWHLQRRHQ